MHACVVQLVLQGHGTELWHIAHNWGRLRTRFNLFSEVYDLLAIVEHGLMWMVGGHVGRRDLRQRGRARDPHEALLVVEGQNLGADVLDARVNKVQTVLSRVHRCNDSIVDIDEGLLSVLDG